MMVTPEQKISVWLRVTGGCCRNSYVYNTRIIVGSMVQGAFGGFFGIVPTRAGMNFSIYLYR